MDSAIFPAIFCFEPAIRPQKPIEFPKSLNGLGQPHNSADGPRLANIFYEGKISGLNEGGEAGRLGESRPGVDDRLGAEIEIEPPAPVQGSILVVIELVPVVDA